LPQIEDMASEYLSSEIKSSITWGSFSSYLYCNATALFITSHMKRKITTLVLIAKVDREALQYQHVIYGLGANLHVYQFSTEPGTSSFLLFVRRRHYYTLCCLTSQIHDENQVSMAAQIIGIAPRPPRR